MARKNAHDFQDYTSQGEHIRATPPGPVRVDLGGIPANRSCGLAHRDRRAEIREVLRVAKIREDQGVVMNEDILRLYIPVAYALLM
jgi:hypothetical protein